MIERYMPAGPCILLDLRMVVVHVAPAMQGWLGSLDPVLAVRQQRLHAPGEALSLDRALSAAAHGVRTAVALARPDRLPLTLRAERLCAEGRDWVLVTLRDPELEVPDPALLQDLYGLTPTEALVAAGLARGMDSAELARAMGVQPNTVLSHIKRVLLKSGTRRQSQLVSLILRSAAMPPHPWLAASTPAPGAGLTQRGRDTPASAGHGRPSCVPAACAAPRVSLSSRQMELP